jgi:putative transposase
MNGTRINAIKSVKFSYFPTSQTRELLETFKDMVNDAIHICIEENISGRLRLRDRIYKGFQEKYGVVSCYPYSVAEVAWSIVRKHRKWQRNPFAKRSMMKMDAQNYSLNYGVLSLPFTKGGRLLVPLEYGNYQRAFLMDTTLKKGSITVTESAIIISFSKEVAAIEPLREVGLDLNEKSLVCSDGTWYDLAEVARLHTEYGVRRSEFSHRNPYDRRLKQKYSGTRREKERVKQLLHRVAKKVVETAKSQRQAIVLERLKGIRYAHQRGNGESKGKRRRIALWPFRLLQTYIVYKSAWEGVQVEFVSPALTSQTCNQCHNVNRKLKLTEREWRCPSCGAILDRDLNAAINIERRGKIPCLGEVRPGAQDTNEAVKGNPTTPVILRAEVLKLTLRREL